MDIPTMSLLIGIIITAIVSLVGVYFAGFAGALILGSLVMLSLAFIPATPIIPIWLSLLVVIIEIIFIAYKAAQAFVLWSWQ